MKTLMTFAAIAAVTLAIGAPLTQAQPLGYLQTRTASDEAVNFPPTYGEPQVVPSVF